MADKQAIKQASRILQEWQAWRKIDIDRCIERDHRRIGYIAPTIAFTHSGGVNIHTDLPTFHLLATPLFLVFASEQPFTPDNLLKMSMQLDSEGLDVL